MAPSIQRTSHLSKQVAFEFVNGFPSNSVSLRTDHYLEGVTVQSNRSVCKPRDLAGEIASIFYVTKEVRQLECFPQVVQGLRIFLLSALLRPIRDCAASETDSQEQAWATQREPHLNFRVQFTPSSK